LFYALFYALLHIYNISSIKLVDANRDATATATAKDATHESSPHPSKP